MTATVQLRGGPRLRWGVLAPGRIARRWAHAVRSHTDHSIDAVASRSGERAAQFADEFAVPRRYDGYEELLGDPGIDAVYIASPNAFHREHALLAIAAGKPALIEKPLATSADDAREIASAARRAGVYVAEGMWSSYLPQTVEIRRMLREGFFGEVRSVHSDLGIRAPFDPASRVFDPALGGGALLDLGVYALWFARLALGAPSAVDAAGTRAPSGVDDHATLLLRHPRAVATATVSLVSDTPRHAWISGDEGRLDFAGSFKDPAPFVTVRGTVSDRWDPPAEVVGFDGLAYQAVAVAQHLDGGLLEAPEHDLASSIGILEVIDDAASQIVAGDRPATRPGG